MFNALTIERMPEGGFIVWDQGHRFDPGLMPIPLFACGSIGEATAFIVTKTQKAEAEAKAAAEKFQEARQAFEQAGKPIGTMISKPLRPLTERDHIWSDWNIPK